MGILHFLVALVRVTTPFFGNHPQNSVKYFWGDMKDTVFYNSILSDWFLIFNQIIRDCLKIIGSQSLFFGEGIDGLGRFYSSIYGRAVKGLNFLSLCLAGVSSKQSAPLLMEAMDAGMKKETQVKKKPTKGTKKRKKERIQKDVQKERIQKDVQKEAKIKTVQILN